MLAMLAKVRDDNALEFRRIFGIPLSRYWSNITGFDVVGFDDNVVKAGEKAGDNESCCDAVKRQWGQEGVDIILRLLGQ